MLLNSEHVQINCEVTGLNRPLRSEIMKDVLDKTVSRNIPHVPKNHVQFLAALPPYKGLTAMTSARVCKCYTLGRMNKYSPGINNLFRKLYSPKRAKYMNTLQCHRR